MVKTIATGLGVLVIASALGLLSAWWAIMHGPHRQTGVANGPWRTSVVTGSEDADIYTRAHVAIVGLFALSPAEAIYFSARVDDTGRSLRARCSYTIEGKPMAARWWSITAYADDNFLIPNPANRFSFNMGNLPLDDRGAFTIAAGPTQRPGNWLPTGAGDKGFQLTLRLYNGAPETLANLETITLPSIQRVGECL